MLVTGLVYLTTKNYTIAVVALGNGDLASNELNAKHHLHEMESEEEGKNEKKSPTENGMKLVIVTQNGMSLETEVQNGSQVLKEVKHGKEVHDRTKSDIVFQNGRKSEMEAQNGMRREIARQNGRNLGLEAHERMTSKMENHKRRKLKTGSLKYQNEINSEDQVDHKNNSQQILQFLRQSKQTFQEGTEPQKNQAHKIKKDNEIVKYGTTDPNDSTSRVTKDIDNRSELDRKLGYCQKRRFEAGHPFTAIASYPGSGNTWTRFLIESVTGWYILKMSHC